MRNLVLMGILTAISLGLISLVAITPEVEAIDLDCETAVRRTNAEWGIGSSCQQADQNAIWAAQGNIPCATCSETPEEVTPCYFDTASGEFHSDWRIRYVCIE